MANPDIKVIACSNVYIRQMQFNAKGDVEVGHCHTFDHATLLSSGSVIYEVLDGLNGNTVEYKEFKAPTMIFVAKDKFHRLTALEDNTVCACIHALRTITEDIISPDFLIESVDRRYDGHIRELVHEKTGVEWYPLIREYEPILDSV
jgi:hypothetical protein